MGRVDTADMRSEWSLAGDARHQTHTLQLKGGRNTQGGQLARERMRSEPARPHLAAVVHVPHAVADDWVLIAGAASDLAPAKDS